MSPASLVARAALVVGSLLLVAVLAELLLRAGVLPTQHLHRTTPRGAESPGRRLVVLGDSFFDPRTEIADFLIERLEPHGYRVLNLAQSGMGPVQYLWELESYGRAFEPDIVLLSYYVGNDLTDVQYPMAQDPDYGVGRGPRDRLRPLARSLYLYHFLKERREALRVRRFDAEALLAHGADPALVDAATRQEINPSLLALAVAHPRYLLDGVLLETDQNRRAWARVQEMLRRIQALTEEIGAELLVVVFPRSIQLDASHFDFFERVGFELDRGTIGSRRPQDALLAHCAEQRLRCLDLLPAFAASGRQLYLPRDDHLDTAGAALAAERVADFVLDAGGEAARP